MSLHFQKHPVMPTKNVAVLTAEQFSAVSSKIISLFSVRLYPCWFLSCLYYTFFGGEGHSFSNMFVECCALQGSQGVTATVILCFLNLGTTCLVPWYNLMSSENEWKSFCRKCIILQFQDPASPSTTFLYHLEICMLKLCLYQ